MQIAHFKSLTSKGLHVDAGGNAQSCHRAEVRHGWFTTHVPLYGERGEWLHSSWHLHPIVGVLGFVLFAAAAMIAFLYLFKWGIIN